MPMREIESGLVLYVSEEGIEQRLFSASGSMEALDAAGDYLGWRPSGPWRSYDDNIEGQTPPPELAGRAVWFLEL